MTRSRFTFLRRQKKWIYCFSAALMLLTCCPFLSIAQQTEDSLQNKKQISLTAAQKLIASSGEDLLSGGNAGHSQTVISGYGEAAYQHDFQYKNSTIDLARAVLFVGHQFNNKIAFFSELEVEDAKVEGGGHKGTVGMEQAYLRFNFNPRQYLVAGLFLPRIGILNENHLPTTFNGNNRPFVETMVIPSTWREIGVAIYGQSSRLPGLNWSAGIFNGLNSSAFGGGEGIREGRFEGREATATNLAITGALLYYRNALRVQVSAYYGGSAGLAPREADSLQLSSGPFGTPVMLGEADVQYLTKGFIFKALGTAVSIPDAQAINRAYANNTPELMWGAYAEVGYNLFNLTGETEKNLTVFARYETLDLNAQMPENGIKDDFTAQQYIVGGVTWMPVRGVAIKADYVQRMTGDPNPALQINPFINGQTFYASRGFVNLGVAYSF